MNGKRKLVLGVVLVALVAGLWLAQGAMQQMGAQTAEVPRFEVDPFWPQPLPNHWLLGSTIGLWVDDEDHVWIIHRSSDTLGNQERGAELDPPTGECCAGAPPVLSFDPEGNLARSWGGPSDEYDWPTSNHGIFVDHLGFVWIGGNGAGDAQVLKFTKEGEFVAQYGQADARQSDTDGEGNAVYTRDSHSPDSFGRVAKIFVDAEADEAYLADGYFNRRVAVLDANTGEMKRYWGAYGNEPDDDYEFGPRGADEPPAQQFRGPVHCADVTQDRLVYVCDRQSNRLQVFTPEGEFVSEAFYAPASLGEGSTWDVAFSRDPEQRYIYLADGRNMKVRIILRETMEEIGSFGDGGRQPGQFYAVHSIATDSQGNIYTTETYEGKRLQKFVDVGTGDVRDQGVPWPQ